MAFDRNETPPFLVKALRRFGVDRAVAFTILGKVWRILGAPLSIVLIVSRLTEVEQGFYYTFGSVLALNTFFDLGLAQVVLRFSSNEMGGLRWGKNGLIQGDTLCKQRLASILQLIVHWYMVIAVVFLIILLPLGLWLFSTQGQSQEGLVWLAPWIFLVVVTSLNLFLAPILGFIQGCGHVTQIEQIKLIASLFSTAALWTALLLDWNLYSLAFSVSVGLAVLVPLFLSKYYNSLAELWHCTDAKNKLSWRWEIWPFQWKVAVSWLFGYFTTKFIIPIVFAFQGPEEAGRLGLAISLITHVSAIATAWFTTKAPMFGALVQRREWAKLDDVFRRSLLQSLVFLIPVCLLMWGGVAVINLKEYSFATRILAPLGIAILAGTRIINHLTIAFANYLRAHREEPFLSISIFHGLMSGVFTAIFAKWFDVNAILIANLIISIVVLVWGYRIFLRSKWLWHGSHQEVLKVAT